PYPPTVACSGSDSTPADRSQYFKEVERLIEIDEIEKYLNKLARQEICSVQEVENDERSYGQEPKGMKLRDLYRTHK
ncbi:hypothetical protein BGZ81_001637, partial [Podila clonocystis]